MHRMVWMLRKNRKKPKIKVLYQPYWVQVIIERRELLFDHIIYFLAVIKTENINLYPIVNLDRDLSTSPPPALAGAASIPISNIEVPNTLGSFE